MSHVGPQTGSSNNFLRVGDKSTISDSITMFSMVPDTVEHRSASKTNCIYTKCNMVDHKPEVDIAYVVLKIEIRFQILTERNIDRQ